MISIPRTSILLLVAPLAFAQVSDELRQQGMDQLRQEFERQQLRQQPKQDVNQSIHAKSPPEEKSVCDSTFKGLKEGLTSPNGKTMVATAKVGLTSKNEDLYSKCLRQSWALRVDKDDEMKDRIDERVHKLFEILEGNAKQRRQLGLGPKKRSRNAENFSRTGQ